MCSSRHSRARFSFRPRLPRWPAGLSGPDRADVVEIEQHRRVAHHRQQHVGEAAGDMRADRLLDEGARQRGALAAAQRDREVVGPEPDQPFAERRRRWSAHWPVARSRPGGTVRRPRDWPGAGGSAGPRAAPPGRRRCWADSAAAADPGRRNCALSQAPGSVGSGSSPRRPRPNRDERVCDIAYPWRAA